MPSALPAHPRCSNAAVLGQASLALSRTATERSGRPRQRHSLRSLRLIQPHRAQLPQLTPPRQPPAPCRHSLHLPARCSAAVASAGSAGSASLGSSSSSSSSLVTRFWDWWSLGPTEENSKNTQSLLSIARKLWTMLRVNRWLLLGAFSFMVRAGRQGAGSGTTQLQLSQSTDTELCR